MKILVLLLAVLVLFYLLRGRAARRFRPPVPPPPGAPHAMLQCAQCGLHLPSGEALPGRGGVFCGAAHRAAYEQAHPAP